MLLTPLEIRCMNSAAATNKKLEQKRLFVQKRR